MTFDAPRDLPSHYVFRQDDLLLMIAEKQPMAQAQGQEQAPQQHSKRARSERPANKVQLVGDILDTDRCVLFGVVEQVVKGMYVL